MSLPQATCTHPPKGPQMSHAITVQSAFNSDSAPFKMEPCELSTEVTCPTHPTRNAGTRTGKQHDPAHLQRWQVSGPQHSCSSAGHLCQVPTLWGGDGPLLGPGLSWQWRPSSPLSLALCLPPYHPVRSKKALKNMPILVAWQFSQLLPAHRKLGVQGPLYEWTH